MNGVPPLNEQRRDKPRLRFVPRTVPLLVTRCTLRCDERRGSADLVGGAVLELKLIRWLAQLADVPPQHLQRHSLPLRGMVLLLKMAHHCNHKMKDANPQMDENTTTNVCGLAVCRC